MFPNQFKTIVFSILTIQGCCGSFFENVLDYTSLHLQQRSTDHPKANGLDPLHFQQDLSISDPSIMLDLSFNGFLKGFTNYYIKKMVVTPDLKVSLIGTIIDTQISGNYKMNGTFFTVLPMIGDGVYLFHLKNVSVLLDTQITPKDGHLQIEHFDMDYSFDDLMISLWGLTGDEAVGDILEEFSKDLISTTLIKKKNAIIRFLKNFILGKGNAKLKTMTLQNMIELLKELWVY